MPFVQEKLPHYIKPVVGVLVVFILYLNPCIGSAPRFSICQSTSKVLQKTRTKRKKVYIRKEEYQIV